MSGKSQQLIARGLEGSNPLAFLASLGLFRTLHRMYPEKNVKMHWEVVNCAWRPVYSGIDYSSREELMVYLHDKLLETQFVLSEKLGDSLKITPDDFRCYAHEGLHFQDTDKLPFAVAFGSEAKGRELIQTQLCFLNGTGHQYFIRTIENLIKVATTDQLNKAIFEQWMYDDTGKNISLRWDPIDDRRYALRWSDPSTEDIRTEIGANRLAIEALPLFPVIPGMRYCLTTGFSRRKNEIWFTWPVWEVPINIPVCRTLLAMKHLQNEEPLLENLQEIGVVEVFRSQRISVGLFKYTNFTPACSM
ncbi:hypothetical protein GTO89_10640 [Heliobacterium gestii]|uniref:Uncharacterized protein n=1 Tax=Heliomicrobium gestii TaxID=2699 RepID=A0A845LKW9_HELGE|nr:hypothetical protein [Heliomicrobium gestii]MBM7867089.1 hypothetical protein [Heliomicrobium gestii]MZP43496.1 hypothetical protein [Heliomicrobium gestii]